MSTVIVTFRQVATGEPGVVSFPNDPFRSAEHWHDVLGDPTDNTMTLKATNGSITIPKDNIAHIQVRPS